MTAWSSAPSFRPAGAAGRIRAAAWDRVIGPGAGAGGEAGAGDRIRGGWGIRSDGVAEHLGQLSPLEREMLDRAGRPGPVQHRLRVGPVEQGQQDRPAGVARYPGQAAQILRPAALVITGNPDGNTQ